MNKELINNNAPQKLLLLAERWFSDGKSFYLGPENIFYYNFAPLDFRGSENVPKEHGSWYICTSDCLVPKSIQLRKSEIEEIAFEFAKDNLLTYAELDLLNDCNAKCTFCPYHGKSTQYYDNFMKPEEVSVDIETAKKRIDKLYDAGIRNIGIGGTGELLLYKNWEEVMQYISNKGISQCFATNGLLFTEDTAKKLSKIGNVIAAKVSLHSINFDTWSAITGSTNKTLFNNAINAPFLMKKYGIKSVGVAFVKDEKNIYELKDFLDYWVYKVEHVTVSHGVTIEDITRDNYYEQFNEPAGICKHNFGSVLVMPNGRMCPCCGAYLMFNSKNKGTVLDVNIDDYKAEDLSKIMFKMASSEEFKKLCQNCWSPTRSTSLPIDSSICGYKNSETLSVTKTPLGVNLYRKEKNTLVKKIKRRIKKEIKQLLTKKEHF